MKEARARSRPVGGRHSFLTPLSPSPLELPSDPSYLADTANYPKLFNPHRGQSARPATAAAATYASPGPGRERAPRPTSAYQVRAPVATAMGVTGRANHPVPSRLNV
jgi:hypothetical protein